MVKRIALAILLLPLAEIAAFVLVATLVGVTPALLLLRISTRAGVLVLRSAGRGHVAGFGAAAAKAAISAKGSSRMARTMRFTMVGIPVPGEVGAGAGIVYVRP